jgi:hypothetical protein
MLSAKHKIGVLGVKRRMCVFSKVEKSNFLNMTRISIIIIVLREEKDLNSLVYALLGRYG